MCIRDRFEIHDILHVKTLIMVATKMLEKIINLYTIERKSLFSRRIRHAMSIEDIVIFISKKRCLVLKLIDCRTKFHSSVSFSKPLCNKSQEKCYADDSINCRETINRQNRFFGFSY